LRVVLGDFCEGDLCLDDDEVSREHILSEDPAAFSGEVAGDIAHILGGGGDFHIYDWFEEGGLRLLYGVDERAFSGGSEGDFLGVDGVVLAVVDGDLYVLERESGDDSQLHYVVYAFVYGGLELAGDRGAEDVPAKFEGGVGIARGGLDAEVDLTELSSTAGLFFVSVVAFGFGCDGLSVGNLGFFCGQGELETALHFFEYYAEVEVSESGGDELVCLLVPCDFEAGVFVGEFFEGGTDSLLISSGGGLNCECEHGLWYGGHIEFASDFASVDEVSDFEIFDFGECHDVAGDTGVDFLIFGALRFQDVSGSDAFSLVVSEQGGVGLERAGEDSYG